MAYAWNWFGAANLVAALLLFALAALFLKARRSEFTASFALYSTFTAASKFAGGMWLYFSADAATERLWLFVLVLLWLPLFPALAHSLLAFFGGRRFTARPWWQKVGLYAPFVALLPVVLARPQHLDRLGLLFGLAFTLALFPFLVLAAVKWRRATGTVERVQARYMFAYLLIALSFSAEARIIPFVIEGAPFPHWELAIAYAVATAILLYGILKSHLFDIDVRLKWTVKQGTVAGIFIAVFVMASEGAQALFEVRGHAFIGILAAGLLVFAFSPLQRLADRVANVAMPHVRPLGELAANERVRLYEDQVRFAWADGTLDRHERDMLEHLRERLGLSRDEASRLEQRALRASTKS